MCTNNIAMANRGLGRVGSYMRPAELEEALAALAARERVIVAGGTDYYPARVGRPLDDDVLDITGIATLHGIAERDDHWRIGALATWTELLDATLPPLFDGLKLAAHEVGGVQIQNAGTICGNLCNASPAADGVPNLLVVDAAVELVSATATRRLPIAEFVTGNRRTTRRPDEVMTALLVPKPHGAARSHFLKLGARKYLVISIVMVAAVFETDGDNRISAGRVAVGACSSVAQRLPLLEDALRGQPCNAELAGFVAEDQLSPLAPIDDVRGSADYRRDATLTLLRRLLAELGGGLA